MTFWQTSACSTGYAVALYLPEHASRALRGNRQPDVDCRRSTMFTDCSRLCHDLVISMPYYITIITA